MFRAVLFSALVFSFVAPVDASPRDTVIERLRAEPKVAAAEWRSEAEVVIAMPSDGSRRDGFAEYACRLIAHTGLTPEPPVEFFLVTVVDAAVWPNATRKLGWTVCPKTVAGQTALADDAMLLDGVAALGIEPGEINIDARQGADPVRLAAAICGLVEKYRFDGGKPVLVNINGDKRLSRNCR